MHYLFDPDNAGRQHDRAKTGDSKVIEVDQHLAIESPTEQLLVCKNLGMSIRAERT